MSGQRAGLRNKDGNVSTMYALLAPILIFGAGAAIDYGRAAQIQSKLNAAADAAALAALTPAMLQQSASAAQTAAQSMFTGLADFKDVRMVSGDMLRLGGGSMPTHEIQAEAKDAKTDTPMKIVQWVRFGPGAYVRMIGIARANTWAKEFPRFRAVRDGIGPRGED